MTIKSIQKVIKVGSSAGVTFPARDLKHADIAVGDNVEIVVRKASDGSSESDDQVLIAAKDILSRYKSDFDNLSKR